MPQSRQLPQLMQRAWSPAGAGMSALCTRLKYSRLRRAEAMGRAAVDLLLQRKQRPLAPGEPGEEILVPAELVTRGTVAPPPAGPEETQGM